MKDDDLEARVRARCEAGEIEDAVADAVRGYGEEVFSFIAARFANEDDAAEVFSQACEDLLSSLPTFRWRASLRTWFYRLARTAAVRYKRSPLNRGDRRVALSNVSEIAYQVRSRTMAHLRTEVKDRVRALRDRLEEDDRQLLELRIDRDLSWNDIAEVLADDELEDADVARAAAAARQRFQKLKSKLRELAIADGLLETD